MSGYGYCIRALSLLNSIYTGAQEESQKGKTIQTSCAMLGYSYEDSHLFCCKASRLSLKAW
jgi:hypothetical protein